MDSGKLRQNDIAGVDLQPSTRFELVYMRRREFLPLADPSDADEVPEVGEAETGPPSTSGPSAGSLKMHSRCAESLSS